MKRIHVEMDAGAFLLFAIGCFFEGEGGLRAVLPAIAVHELGHIAALAVCKAHIKGLKAGVLGLRLDYTGKLSDRQLAFCLLAGPFCGLLYSLIIFLLLPGSRLSGEISLLLTAFNLLPVFPLDGGRLNKLLFPTHAKSISIGTASVMTVFGLVFLVMRRLMAPLAMGIWLLAENMKQPPL